MQQGIFIDAMDVLNKYIQIAFADITDFVEFGSIEKSERNEDGQVMLDDNFKPITYKEGFVDFKPSDEVDGTIITELKLGRDGVVVKLKIAHAKAFGTDDPEEYEDDGFDDFGGVGR